MSAGLATQLRHCGMRVLHIREEEDGEEIEEFASCTDSQAYNGAIASFNNEHMARLVHHTTNATVLTPAALYLPSLCTTSCAYFIAVYCSRYGDHIIRTKLN